ncbi:pyridoxamine 5'-phosphate oxidase family protein [Yinghuangia sp. ASG 101]|uniref:pyridoxamine 5'-phosphate oxidase family protein n=1 Tax=Yinghuangia sp. ASG 101 TaxID=2896848 RepID=UPI001E578D4B|nr:pyridoxamine 5'-phosphate oxidase family protein [Yinghuangia sp. ASG 101]UGQ14722.1 pyridoxamine 5'-phosphate oxidase family protein [Yinghuangia sp. ASG 101]
MGKVHEEGVVGRLKSFILDQPVFFVATAPLDPDGHVNVSPKGHKGTFAVLDAWTVAYLDWTGSGAETHAHLRENGRITLMWTAFSGPPKVVRLHGRGEAVRRDDPRWPELAALFEDSDESGVRAILVVRVSRVSDSCGFSVPFMDYVGERPVLRQSWERKTHDDAEAYIDKTNRVSLDGLPAVRELAGVAAHREPADREPVDNAPAERRPVDAAARDSGHAG